MDENGGSFLTLRIGAFADTLASKEPVPGGGGASALVGALGAALGSMVGNLTSGKAKYADVQGEIDELLRRSERLRARFLALVDEDAAVFLPLSKAYRLPAGTDEDVAAKNEALEAALKAASDVPLRIMEACGEAIELAAAYAEKGSLIAISDAGVSAVFSKAALIGASLNVFINTKLMKDSAYAEAINSKAESLITEYGKKADDVIAFTKEQLLF